MELKLRRFFNNHVRSQLNLNNGVLAVALLIGSTWAWSTVAAIQRNFELQQQVDALSQQIAVQELENKSQALQNKYYQTSEYLELSARERLGKAAPGEKLLILPPNTVKTTAEEQLPTETPIASRSNFAQWMYFLFGSKRS
jgi:cell division protein FtsB